MQLVAIRFCHIGIKRSVLWPSEYAKIRFRSSRRSPRLASRLEKEHPSPYPTPLGTNLPSTLAMRPPEFQPDLRLCLQAAARMLGGRVQVPRVTQCAADAARSTLADRHAGGGEDAVARHAGRGDTVLQPPRDDDNPAATTGRRGDGGDAVKST